MDRLTAMRVFAEVAASGSFTSTADRLDMSRAMVTRYVGEMEQWLQARLLQPMRRLERESDGRIRLYASLYGHATYAHAEERALFYKWRPLAISGFVPVRLKKHSPEPSKASAPAAV